MKKNGDGIGYSRAESYWNDVPTDDPGADYGRGAIYAKMAIAALASDHNLARGLELTLEHIFLDAVRRREKRGKFSRSAHKRLGWWLCAARRLLSGTAE